MFFEHEQTDRPETRDQHRPSTATREIRGLDARFGTDPREVYVELRSGSPAYVRLREGDYLQEGDAFHYEQFRESSGLDTWEVLDVTPALVVGRDTATGYRREFEREDVEVRLCVGRYSTNLTDFENVSVYQVGDWETAETTRGAIDAQYTGSPHVSVVAYGDNGLKYGRWYGFVEPYSTELALWMVDDPRGTFDEEVAHRLDERIRTALEAEGYTIVEA
jgi:hypothetical protein